VGNLLMSTPVSARASWAERRAQPGIEAAWATCSSYLVFPSFSPRDGALDHGQLRQAGYQLGGVDGPEVRRVAGLHVIA
jgi:hypothetical protein